MSTSPGLSLLPTWSPGAMSSRPRSPWSSTTVWSVATLYFLPITERGDQATCPECQFLGIVMFWVSLFSWLFHTRSIREWVLCHRRRYQPHRQVCLSVPHWTLLMMFCLGMTRRARLTARLMTISKPSLSFLFAGVSKNTQQEHKVRGDINVLLCGDPGKVSVLEVCPEDCSQGCFLHRTGSFCCWSDSYVQRSQLTNEWTSEALVLADEGVCLIWQDEQ